MEMDELRGRKMKLAFVDDDMINGTERVGVKIH